MDNISAASKFFGLIENVYCFFSASTHRWELLVNVLGVLPIVKYLSDTRWDAHSDTLKALNCGYEKIRMVLEQFTENLDETAKARQEARGILSKLNTLENYILLVFWSVVMERFHQTSIKLQRTNMDLNEAMKLLRDAFEDFEDKGRSKLVLKMSRCTKEIPKKETKKCEAQSK